MSDIAAVCQGQILFISSLEETVRDADFVFEVVPEDLKIKQELFKSMLPVLAITRTPVSLMVEEQCNI